MIGQYPKICVVISCHNNSGTILRCIRSLKEQIQKPKEIIIIDSGSHDNVDILIKKSSPGIKVIKISTDIGRASAFNIGINASKSNPDYFLFIEPNLIAEKSMIKMLLQLGEKDPKIGILTPQIINLKRRNQVFSRGCLINLWTGKVTSSKKEEVDYASLVMLVKKEVVNKIASFNDKYFFLYDDADFCFRAKRKGYKTFFVKDANCYIDFTSSKIKERRSLSISYLSARNKIIFMSDHGKNFYIFLLIVPFYIIGISVDAILNNNLKSLKDYINGCIAGLISELSSKRVLIHLPFSLYSIIKNSIGVNTRTVLDVGCGDGRFMSVLNADRKWSVLGVDIYKTELIRAEETGVYGEVVLGDVRKIVKIIGNRKFDTVFCSEVIEHLKKNDGIKLLTDMEKVGKRVVVVTPRGMLTKEEPYFNEGNNQYQIHKSSWEIEDFKKRGYTVKGVGVSFLIGESRCTGRKVWGKYRYLIPVKLVLSSLENLLAFLVAVLPYHFPEFSTGLVVIKLTE
ncbi:hypothetical protein A3D00_00145 [Candidatus Woesebacteria bacterium RIFCSPHIGHO2_02_FULL_38_9]|nr:MAG: hypothetical protein A3D00_00145 [Candidatus Woesebacteria bacterium RIFCSPHIGHO2_02_FULL_38_9]OGM57852.1 MAG: hypothetical protein A3A50_02455 [Candidatus Woesebacteria bacterium RIFCSPLOWO2_01_FULL_38_20]